MTRSMTSPEAPAHAAAQTPNLPSHLTLASLGRDDSLKARPGRSVPARARSGGLPWNDTQLTEEIEAPRPRASSATSSLARDLMTPDWFEPKGLDQYDGRQS